tara:strand:- start:458 stop:769 length:312 start_codon:yes stop_codon:yes gene_type:complete
MPYSHQDGEFTDKGALPLQTGRIGDLSNSLTPHHSYWEAREGNGTEREHNVHPPEFYEETRELMRLEAHPNIKWSLKRQRQSVDCYLTLHRRKGAKFLLVLGD